MAAVAEVDDRLSRVLDQAAEQLGMAIEPGEALGGGTRSRVLRATAGGRRLVVKAYGDA